MNKNELYRRAKDLYTTNSLLQIELVEEIETTSCWRHRRLGSLS